MGGGAWARTISLPSVCNQQAISLQISMYSASTRMTRQRKSQNIDIQAISM